MRSINLILFLMLLSVPCAAQSVCDAESTKTIQLENLRLAMSPDEVQAVVGRTLKIKIKRTGERTFFQNFIDRPSPRTLPGVRAVYLRFFEGRLYQIEIFYENRSDWPTLVSFTAKLSANMDLPAQWPTEKGKSELRCGAISLVADQVLNPRIEITDEAVRAQVEILRKKKD